MNDRLRALMKKKGVGVGELSKSIDYNRRTITFWLNGTTSPSAAAIVALCKYFNVSADWLLFGKE